jgi:hypothetical protein
MMLKRSTGLLGHRKEVAIVADTNGKAGESISETES